MDQGQMQAVAAQFLASMAGRQGGGGQQQVINQPPSQPPQMMPQQQQGGGPLPGMDMMQALARRIQANSQPPPPGGYPPDRTVVGSPNDHIGLTEQAQGSLLDQLVQEISRGQMPGSKPDPTRILLPNASPYPHGQLIPNVAPNTWSRGQLM